MLDLYEPPTTTLATLAEFKERLGIVAGQPSPFSDSHLTALLMAASDLVEKESNMCYRDQVWIDTLDYLPDPYYPPKLPIRNMVVTCLRDDGEVEILVDWYMVGGQYTAKAHFKSQPNVDTSLYGNFNMRLECGTDHVPPVAKQACLMLAAAWKDQVAEAEITGTITSEVKLGFDRLIRSIRRGHLCA